MDKDKILKYQEKDAQLFKLERELDQNENKKVANQMIAVVRELQSRSAALEQDAETLAKEYDEMLAKYEALIQKSGTISEANLEDATEEEIEKALNESVVLTNTLAQLEKKCILQAERVSNILAEFEESKKKFGIARAKHKTHKELYEQTAALSKPAIEALKKELLELERDLPTTLIAKYKLVRQDKIFPVFVPIFGGRSCGGCQMELSTNKIETLKQIGYIECENCRRQIYNV